MKETQPREGLTIFDFAAEFKTRLEKIQQLSDEASHTDFFSEVDINRVRRKAAALVFPRSFDENAPLEIWVDDITDSYFSIHENARRSFNLAFPNAYDDILFFRAYSAMLVQDWENKLYLFFDENLTREIEEMKKEGIFLGKKPEKNPASWEKLMKNYNISKIAGTFEKRTNKDDGELLGWVDQIMLDVDIIGKLRESLMIKSFKDKYSMNLAQFMRFRALIESARSSQTSISYDEIAKQIMKL